MGLHISRLEVRNFRNFQHLVIDKFPAHAVIVGENGVGKSNLLEAIRLVLDPSLPDSRRMLREEDIWEGHPTGLSGGAEVTVVVDLQGYDDDDDAKSVLSSAAVGFPISLGLPTALLPASRSTPPPIPAYSPANGR